MQTQALFQQSLDTIEAQLKAELRIQELADAAGYSLYHYCRLFRQQVGMPVGQYITRRKLLHAAWEIANGSRVIDAALSYGFATGAGFYKAFVREFQCSPSAYIAGHTVRRPYQIQLIEEEHRMLNKKQLKSILSHWGLQDAPITDYYYAGTGNRADCEWDVGEQWHLRMESEPARMEKQLRLSELLAERGFPTPPPVRTSDGALFAAEDTGCYGLWRRPMGEPLSSAALCRNPSLAEPMGRLLGQLSLQLAALPEDCISCAAPELLAELQTWAVPETLRHSTLPPQFFTDLLARFAACYDQLPRQLIHRNPCCNYFTLRDGAVAGITGFEMVERNVRIFDPCYAATSLLSEHFEVLSPEPERWLTLLRGILRGFDSVVHLTDAEKRAVPMVIFGIQMICVAYFGRYEKYRELLRTNLAMLDWLAKLNLAIGN